MYEDNLLARPSQLDLTRMKIRAYVDSTIPYTRARWLGAAALATVYLLRVLIWPSYYMVTYVVAIFILNGFLSFITPKVTPLIDETDGSMDLPTNDEEFKPFIRKLPEFHFWLSTVVSLSIALFCTCFRAFDVDVFWPILLIYFIMLFTVTMKDRIEHMFKYNYLPFNIGKKRYHTVNT